MPLTRETLLQWVPLTTIRVMVQDSLVGVVFLIIIGLVSPLLDLAVRDKDVQAQLHRLEHWATFGSYVVILAGGFARLIIRIGKEILVEFGVGNGNHFLA